MILSKLNEEILILVRKGLLSRDIATEMGIDRYVVEQEIKYLCQRFHVRDKTQLSMLKE